MTNPFENSGDKGPHLDRKDLHDFHHEQHGEMVHPERPPIDAGDILDKEGATHISGDNTEAESPEEQKRDKAENEDGVKPKIELTEHDYLENLNSFLGGKNDPDNFYSAIYPDQENP